MELSRNKNTSNIKSTVKFKNLFIRGIAFFLNYNDNILFSTTVHYILNSNY